MPNCVAFPNLHVCQKTIARRREGGREGRRGGGRDIERRGILGKKGAGENREGRKMGRGH